MGQAHHVQVTKAVGHVQHDPDNKLPLNAHSIQLVGPQRGRGGGGNMKE